MVIGEDLGTVPDEVRAGLQRARVMSYRVLYFERDAAGDYKRPEAYPVDALVAASTHDLATLAGFWEGHDLEVRRKLDLFPSEQVRLEYVGNRAAEVERLGAALERERLLPAEETRVPGPMLDPHVAEAIHAYLARTPARLFVVQLEDVLGVREQANLPGTVEEQPNWRRRLPLTLEAIERDQRFIRTAETLARARPATRARSGRELDEQGRTRAKELARSICRQDERVFSMASCSSKPSPSAAGSGKARWDSAGTLAQFRSGVARLAIMACPQVR